MFTTVLITYTSAGGKSIITLRICINGKCEISTTDYVSTTPSILHGEETNVKWSWEIEEACWLDFWEKISETLKDLR